MYSIGHLIYGLDATFTQYSQSECATKVLGALAASVKEDPAAFHLNTDEAHAFGFHDDDEGPDSGECRDILTESFGCWSTYSGSGEGNPCAIGIDLGSFDPCSNYPLSEICKEARVGLEQQTAYKKVLEALPEAFAARLKEIEPQVFVIWGTS